MNLKLTNSNFQALGLTFHAADSVKAFQDAIRIALTLGIDYLWIDSLCIIQDDEDDWRQESLLISTVYGNFYLNIAATGASDGSQGCFFENNSRKKINKLQVGGQTRDGKNKRYDCIPTYI